MVKTITIDEIFCIIKDKLLRNCFPENKKINQSELAAELGVSRTPITKALHMLCSYGLLDNIPNKGFYPHIMNIKEYLNIYEMRDCLEQAALFDLAVNITQEQLDELYALFRPFQGLDIIDHAEYSYNHYQFHKRIIEMSSNHLLGQICNSYMIVEKCLLAGAVCTPRINVPSHIQLLDALSAHDLQRVRELALKHCARTIGYLRSTVANMNNLGLNPEKIPVIEVIKTDD